MNSRCSPFGGCSDWSAHREISVRGYRPDPIAASLLSASISQKSRVRCSQAVRALVAQKHDALETQLHETERMCRELSLLLKLCRGAADHCPILERMEDTEPRL